MPRITLARQTKAQRRLERGHRTLDEQRIRPHTLNNRYKPAVLAFLDYLCKGPTPSSLPALDFALAQFIEALYEEGDHIGKAADTLSGLTHFLPLVKGHLRYSWSLFKAWRKSELPAQAPPFDDLLVSGLSGLAYRVGLPALGASLLLAYHCLLRSGEIFSLRCSDVMISPDAASGALTLTMTKKNLRDSVRISDPLVLRFALRRLHTSPPHALFIECTPAQARYALSLLLKFFGLEPFGFRWYSARRGGATTDFRVHGLMERTLIRGRWENSRTARIYITDGISALINLQFTNSQRHQLNAHAAFLLQLDSRLRCE